jgi:hypothetical protein
LFKRDSKYSSTVFLRVSTPSRSSSLKYRISRFSPSTASIPGTMYPFSLRKWGQVIYFTSMDSRMKTSVNYTNFRLTPFFYSDPFFLLPVSAGEGESKMKNGQTGEPGTNKKTGKPNRGKR